VSAKTKDARKHSGRLRVASCDRRQMDEPSYEPETPEAIKNSPVYAFFLKLVVFHKYKCYVMAYYQVQYSRCQYDARGWQYKRL